MVIYVLLHILKQFWCDTMADKLELDAVKWR